MSKPIYSSDKVSGVDAINAATAVFWAAEQFIDSAKPTVKDASLFVLVVATHFELAVQSGFYDKLLPEDVIGMAEETLKLTPMETLKTNLAAAIDAKQARETALAEARNNLVAAETQLQALERTRMQNEQQLHPMRDAVEQSRLNEQEARLHFEQCMAGLLENGQSEELLSADLAENTKTTELVRKTSQLQQQIIELGAVNLAAIQELATETERKNLH